MKTLLLSIIVLLLCSFTLAQQKVAQQKEVNKDGELRITPKKELEWRALTPEEIQAHKNPGVEIPVGSYSEIYNRLDFFHYENVKQFKQVVLYDGQKLLTLEKETEVKSGAKFAWYLVLIIISIIFMIIGNIFIRSKDLIVVAAAAFAVAVVAAAAAAFAFVAVAAAAAAFVAAAADNPKKKAYYFTSAIYYIFAVIALFI